MITGKVWVKHVQIASAETAEQSADEKENRGYSRFHSVMVNSRRVPGSRYLFLYCQQPFLDTRENQGNLMKLRTWIRKNKEDGEVIDARRLLKWFEKRKGIGYERVADDIRRQIAAGDRFINVSVYDNLTYNNF